MILSIMKSLKRTILYLSDSLKKRDKLKGEQKNEKAIKKTFQEANSGYDDEIFGYQWDDSKLSNSYKAIKRLSYQKWR